jgi:hypothetical protein
MRYLCPLTHGQVGGGPACTGTKKAKFTKTERRGRVIFTTLPYPDKVLKPIVWIFCVYFHSLLGYTQCEIIVIV